MTDVLDFLVSAIGVIGLILGAGSSVFYPKQTISAIRRALDALDDAMRRWAWK